MSENQDCSVLSASASATTSPQPTQLDKMQEQLSKIVFQLAPLGSLLEDVRCIKEELSSLKDSIEMAHHVIGDFAETVKGLETRVFKVEEIANEVPSLREEIAKLNSELEARDQFARANNLEIRGIPQSKNENLYEIADRIGTMLNLSIKKEEINYIARIPTRLPKIEKPIIIAFNNRYRKEELIALARKKKQTKLSDIGFNDNTGNFYLNDHLTPRNKGILSKAKTLAKEKNFQYIWVKHCKIMARKSDTSPIIFIRDENDLKKIT